MTIPKLLSFINSHSYILGRSLSEPRPIPIQAKNNQMCPNASLGPGRSGVGGSIEEHVTLSSEVSSQPSFPLIRWDQTRVQGNSTYCPMFIALDYVTSLGQPLLVA